MLIEVKVKTVRTVEDKIRKKSETYLIDKEFFAEAEYAITQELSEEQNSKLLESFDILSLRQSQVKEICTEYKGNSSFIATLKDIFLEADGTEKILKYKVLLWADSLSEAMARTNVFARQGYNMAVEGLKEVDYIYIDPSSKKAGAETQEKEDNGN